MPLRVQMECRKPPTESAKTVLKTPAKPNCQPVATKVSVLNRTRRDSTEPTPKLNAANSRTKTPSTGREPLGSAPSWCIDGHTSTHIPATPSIVPAHPRRFRRSPLGSTVSISAIMIGMVETPRDANPGGTIWSAHVSAILLADMKSTPISASRQNAPGTTRKLLPRARERPAMIAAAKQHRTAETTGADRCSPAMWIPAYVEPQNKYTDANASGTSVDFGMRESMCCLCYRRGGLPTFAVSCLSL